MNIKRLIEMVLIADSVIAATARTRAAHHTNAAPARVRQSTVAQKKTAKA